MKNQYLKLMLVLLITFPSLLGCRAARRLPEVVDGASDIWRKIRGVLEVPNPNQVRAASEILNPNDVSRLKKSIKQLASKNLKKEAINNGNKISKQKVDKEIERQMKKMKRTLNRTLDKTQEKQIEEEVEKEVEKDLEENGITVTAD